MDDAFTKISLQGKERESVLYKIEKKMNSWGLSLPRTTPDPLHFGYNRFEDIGETEFNINNNIEQGYCGKFMFMFKGQTCPRHHHRKKHETFFIVKGRIELELEGKQMVMRQGDTRVVSQNARHEFTALEDSLILESSKPDLPDDSFFEDPAINVLIFGEPNP